ncbi:GTPase HflX [Candidatus Gracilibacteria bacterium]|nr:GTPase HflX [Candidatus Gracilibacteria bacterium]MCF7819252.1 GTPase HflX [Candidatus Gracilibacteria bacterium]
MARPRILRTLILDIVDKGVSREDAEERLVELRNLIRTAGGIVIKKIIQKRGRPSAKTFLGTGKIQEASMIAKEKDIDLVIVNGLLKPNQYLHLQHAFPKKMLWDRTDLILGIFDKHASSRLAQLQIKLARLQHEIPKLYARQATTLFERAGAGIGTRGPGEKGIEAEKRHIRSQIKQIDKKIQTLQRTHSAQRHRRIKNGLPTISLIGYTNAGKSSLMQLLTEKENVVANNALFTTLDTRIGKTWLPDSDQEVLVADTIGFIADVPPTLISSFLTTLEEARNADLLLHVIDISDPKYQQKIQVVQEILQQLGCEDMPQLYVCNKMDVAQNFDFEDFSGAYAQHSPILISCMREKNLNFLKRKISCILDKKSLALA